MAGLAIRLAAVVCGTPYEVKRKSSGEVRAVGRFELEQLGDYDINAVVFLAESRRGDWIDLPTPKSRTIRTYR